MKNACVKCKHFFMDGEGWELPQFDYAMCSERPQMANLMSFPFRDTKCSKFESILKEKADD